MDKLQLLDDHSSELTYNGLGNDAYDPEEYVDSLIAGISYEGPAVNEGIDSEEDYEVEDSAERTRKDKLRTALGGAATGMVARFKESREVRKFRREMNQALREARREVKASNLDDQEDAPRFQKLRKKMGTIAVAGVGVGLAAVAADNLMPDQLQAFDSYLSNNLPGYDNFSNYANSVGGEEVESYDTAPDVQEHEIQYGASVQTFIVGGAGDPTGEGAKAALGGIAGETVEYSASIAPSGPETMRDSIDEAIPKVSEILHEAEHNPDEQYNLHGYSLGSVTVAESANSYVENGGEINENVEMDLYGSPLVENTGVFSGGSAETVQDVMDDAGIVSDTPLPEGADTHSFKTDFWSNAGNAPVTSQVSMFAGFASDGHHLPIEGQNAVLTGETEMSNGGTSYSYEHVEGPQNPILRTAEEYIPEFQAEHNPDLTNFVDAVAPIGEVGSPDIPQIDTYQVIETGAAAIDEQVEVFQAPPVHAEQFVADVGVENIAPVVEPIVEHLNQPMDLSVLNTPEVSHIVEQAQDFSSTHLPENFDPINEMNNISQQAENFGIQLPF